MKFNKPPFEDDGQAIDNLDAVKIEYRGGIIKLRAGFDYPKEVVDAVNYLCSEWDYDVMFEP